MSDADRRTGDPSERDPQGERLDSWKKIASYLKRDVSTVQRWERREAMPVHRHLHYKLGSVYAFGSELDAWRTARGSRLTETEEEEEREKEPEPAGAGLHRLLSPRGLMAAAALAMLALAGALAWFLSERGYLRRDPFADARITRLTDYAGTEQAAAISRNGKLAAFLTDREGRVDAWLTEIGSGRYLNLTAGRVPELINPSVRLLGFSADGSLVSIWSRSADGSRPDDISLLTAPTAGGPLALYLRGAAELDWSQDGGRLVFHTTAPGDPLFVEAVGGSPREIYRAPPGIHCHFPLWSLDGSWIYFVRGVPPERWDIWRIAPSGAGLERLTYHNALITHPTWVDRRTLAYLATDAAGSGPWLYEMDLEQRHGHRVSFGLERYTSLSASADGLRLVATVSDPRADLWRVRLGEAGASGTVAMPLALVTGAARSPRLGPGYLLYVSEHAGRRGLWKLAGGTSRELWSDPRGDLLGAAAIAPDGHHIAFAVERSEAIDLYVMDADGKDARLAAPRLALRGGLAWDADGRSIVAALDQQGEPRLSRIPLDGGAPLPLVAEYSLEPAYAPDGQYLVYSGADVGTTFPLRAAAADGRPYPLPSLILTRGARRVVFLRDGHTLVVLRGEIGHKDFWRIDLKTGGEQRLTQLPADFVIRDFDVSADGSEIVFDRVQENSHIALIERRH